MNGYLLLLATIFLFSSCGDPNPLYCQRDEDCNNANLPFCDALGVHPASDGVRNTCIPFPILLNVTVVGDGVVTSQRPGIDCGTDCNGSYIDGATVVLSATANGSSIFVDWSGDCMNQGDCLLTMDVSRAVTATFAPTRTLSVERVGSNPAGGQVVSNPPGIDCPGTCVADFGEGSSVTLTATELTGGTFTGWPSETTCPGFGVSCTITLPAANTTVQATFDTAGEYKWDRLLWLNLGNPARYVDITFDNTGNMILLGFFSGTSNFGLGNRTAVGSSDVFVVKLAPNGDPIWDFVFGSSAPDSAGAIVVDANDNVYVAGGFGADMSVNLATHRGPGAIVVKLASTGTVIWSQSVRTSVRGAFDDVAVDSAGRVVAWGHFVGGLSVNNTQVANSVSGSQDIFANWMTSDGVHIEVRPIGSSGFDTAATVATTPDGDAVFSGEVGGQVDLNGTGPGGSFAGPGGFLTKMGPGASFSWVEPVAGSASTTVDASGSIWWSTGDNLVQYDNGANELYTATFTNANTTHMSLGTATQDVTLAGYFSGGVDFGGGVLSPIGGGADLCVANFDETGNHRWSRAFGGTAGDSVYGAAVGPNGRVALVVGVSIGADFGGGVRGAGGYLVVYGP